MPDYFAMADINSDGHIDYEEFSGIYETFDLPVETIKVNRMCFGSSWPGVPCRKPRYIH